MVVKWQMVRELHEGEFRIRKDDGKCFLEKMVKEPENVTAECSAELYSGPCCTPGSFYIRLKHGDKVVAIVAMTSGIELRRGGYEIRPMGGYSFEIFKHR